MLIASLSRLLNKLESSKTIFFESCLWTKINKFVDHNTWQLGPSQGNDDVWLW